MPTVCVIHFEQGSALLLAVQKSLSLIVAVGLTLTHWSTHPPEHAMFEGMMYWGVVIVTPSGLFAPVQIPFALHGLPPAPFCTKT